MLKIKYEETKRIRNLLNEIEALRIVFDNYPSSPSVEEEIRRQSLLKSSVFSARVEGNPLTEKTLNSISKKEEDKKLHKIEVFNLLAAYKYVYFGKTPKELTSNFLFKLHKITMNNISGFAGKLRREPWAIFNQAGIAVYLAPPFLQLPELIKNYLKIINSKKYPVPVSAAIAQFLLEKIHPFADGNGRVGRLVSVYVLNSHNYSFKGMVSFEEYIDEHREQYYMALEPDRDIHEFVEFFLLSLISQAKKVLESLNNKDLKASSDLLLPRRREILSIIKDHPECSFDFISRRFSEVNKKTLHYDLGRLIKQGMVQKIGATRGSLYKAK